MNQRQCVLHRLRCRALVFWYRRVPYRVRQLARSMQPPSARARAARTAGPPADELLRAYLRDHYGVTLSADIHDMEGLLAAVADLIVGDDDGR